MTGVGERSFPPAKRLRQRREFQQTWQGGGRKHVPHFQIIVRHRPGAGISRLGITVSRKIGGAVQRNRVKRRLREFFRLHYRELPEDSDISVIAKKGAAEIDSGQLAEELGVLVRWPPAAKNHGPGSSTAAT